MAALEVCVPLLLSVQFYRKYAFLRGSRLRWSSLAPAGIEDEVDVQTATLACFRFQIRFKVVFSGVFLEGRV